VRNFHKTRDQIQDRVEGRAAKLIRWFHPLLPHHSRGHSMSQLGLAIAKSSHHCLNLA
jgi:hypothetical protein